VQSQQVTPGSVGGLKALVRLRQADLDARLKIAAESCGQAGDLGEPLDPQAVYPIVDLPRAERGMGFPQKLRDLRNF